MPGALYIIPIYQDAKPFASRPYNIPHAQVATFKRRN
jgi:hypothetical protein